MSRLHRRDHFQRRKPLEISRMCNLEMFNAMTQQPSGQSALPADGKALSFLDSQSLINVQHIMIGPIADSVHGQT